VGGGVGWGGVGWGGVGWGGVGWGGVGEGRGGGKEGSEGGSIPAGVGMCRSRWAWLHSPSWGNTRSGGAMLACYSRNHVHSMQWTSDFLIRSENSPAILYFQGASHPHEQLLWSVVRLKSRFVSLSCRFEEV
jgi:hypothetical protein